MKNNSIYIKLINDSYTALHPDIYYTNQENQINKPNTHKERGWRGFLDGGKVSKFTKDYNANYTFDFENPIHKNLSFISFDADSGIYLLDFIKSTLEAPTNIFVLNKGLEVNDIRKYLFKVNEIEISNSNIDDLLLKVIKRYFHNLTKINFVNCKIKKECNFNIIDTPISFNECEIEDNRVFNNTKADIDILRTSIKHISPSTINTNKLDIRCLSKENNINIRELFLKCNFPNLKIFSISYDSLYTLEHSYNDSFKYLPDSAPNIEYLSILGKVDTLDFLTKFKYLINTDIKSIYDDYSFWYATVNSHKEQDKILNRNMIEYTKQKYLEPNKDDKFIIGNLEKERIIKLSHFLSLISYTVEDKKILLNNNLINHLCSINNNSNINRYYETYNDNIILRDTKYMDDMFKPHYEMKNNFLYNYDSLKGNKQIVEAKNYMLNYNGDVVILNKYIKPYIPSKEEIENRIVYHEYDFNDFINDLKKYNGDINLGYLMDYLGEEHQYKINAKDFSLLENKILLQKYYDNYKRKNQRLDEISSKQKKYEEKIENIIRTYYDSFTPQEKKYLYDCSKKNNLNNIFVGDSFYTYEEEKALVDSIDSKTNGLYSKYKKLSILCFKQYYMLDNPCDIMIKEEDIKKLKLK